MPVATFIAAADIKPTGAKAPGAESVGEIVLVFNSPDLAADQQQTTTGFQLLESQARSCPPTDSQVIQAAGITVTETVSTADVVLGVWKGSRTTTMNVLKSPARNGVAKSVDYIYYLIDPRYEYYVFELDVNVANVDASAQIQQEADALAARLVQRLAG